MTRSLLLLRNLLYFRWANLAVVAGMAVATAVLTGALMVGDSVRGSLRELAEQRLGKVDQALVATRFFDQSLAERLSSDDARVVPSVILRGGASDESARRRTAGVQIAALGGSWLAVSRGEAVVNAELARDLGVGAAGAPVLLSIPAIHDAPGEATLARRSRQEVLSGLRVNVGNVVGEPGFSSMFSLQGSQRVPRNAWVNLAQLQQAVEQPGRVNALLAEGAAPLNERLKQAVTLDDYGISLSTAGDGETVVNSRSTYVDPPVLRASVETAGAMGVPVRQVSVYLVNTLATTGAGGKKIHYAVVAGISEPGIKDDEIALNEWTAKQLGAKVGDAIRFDYYQRQPNGDLAEVGSDRPGVGLGFRVARILPMTGLGADPSLTPEYKGLTDADSVSDWDPPEGVRIDKALVTKEDEAYWKEYRAAPKALIALDAARKLWGGAYGDVTSVRVNVSPDKREEFARSLRDRIDPAAMGMQFRPIRAEQLAAAGGSTDFAMLFVGFSFFLIAAAALLVAMLFRLNVEQRARQVGLLAAVGFGPGALRRLALGEGMMLAVIGGVVGLAGAVAYTWLMVTGLRTWWVDAVGTTAMRLFVEPRTLVIGLVASLAVAFVAILWAVWHVGRTEAARLLAGGRYANAAAARRRGAPVATTTGIAAGAVGVLMLVLGMTGAMAPKNAFLGGGSLLLLACLSLLAARLRPRRRAGDAAGALSLLSLGVRNATRHTARSVLSVGLIAFAAFTLVTVASMKEGPPADTHEKSSGAGGYRLILQADIPLAGDLGSPRGRELLGVDLKPEEAAALDRARFMSLRSWAGQDISCLNLTRPSTPTILAVPHAMVERGGFTAGKQNVLAPLEKPIANNEVPVITDAETATYILKLSVGDTMDITDQRGVARKLKLAGTLEHSIFQSEMLMSEDNFRQLFPAQSGFGTVLVETDAGDEETVRKALLGNLGDYSVTVDRTADRLAAYARVKNTYLSTFQTLGSLGLMLGSIGLAVVLMRNLVERRAELALLTAIGFGRGRRVAVVLWENSFLLAMGLLVGAGCALVGILPTLAGGGRTINLAALAGTLGAVLVIGLGALTLAVWLGQRRISPADLRAE
jgi:ABC-type lipoprotein release transport system permease subunit